MPRFNSFVYDLITIFKPEIIDGLCNIKFRLSPRYRERIAPFGFDWMRTGDSLDYVEYDLPYKENMGRYFIDEELTEPSVKGGDHLFFGSQPEMYVELCKSYLPGNLKYFPSEEGKVKSYHVPVLSIYPYSHEHSVICYLSLEITIKRQIDRIQFEYDKTLFEINGIDILSTEQGKHVYHISIKCIQELNQDEYIHVISVNHRGKVRKAGMIRIGKNAKVYQRTLDILLVNVKCLSSEDEYATVLSSNIDTARESIERLLPHALITPAIKEIELDLGYNPALSSRFMKQNGCLCLLANNIKTEIDGRLTLLDDSDVVIDTLTNKLEDMLNIDHYDAMLYCLGMEVGNLYDNTYQRVNGYSEYKNVVLAMDYSGTTAVHELLHTLGLGHTFDNFHKDDTVTKYTYRIYSTDNIMDYTHLKEIQRTNLWEWQWNKIREACPLESEL